MLALNVVPIMASIIALLLYIKLKGWGFGSVEFSVLLQTVRGLFVGHMKFFAVISPFFLALLIGESISGESGRGYLKTLLLMPIPRWQVLVAKGIAVLLFLLLALFIGGLFLQMNLWVARAMTESPNLIMDLDKSVSTSLIDAPTAFNLLLMSFVSNLAMVSYFILFALFFDSGILMTFVSLIVLLAMQSFVFMAPYLDKLDPRYEKVAEWCFTRHLSRLSEITTLMEILEGKLALSSREIFEPLLAGLGWTVLFFVISILYFQRRQVLN